MSSDSELDEFYDAEEATPKVQRQISSQLLEEEQRILESKKIADERRRAEDAEIERKLAEIEERKQQELDQTEAERRAIQNEKRRKKLEEMREAMVEDGSPIKPPLKPPRVLDADEELSESTDLKTQLPKSEYTVLSDSDRYQKEPNVQPETSTKPETKSNVIARSNVEADVSDIILDNINLNTPECDRLKGRSKNIPELVQSETNENTSDNGSVATLSSPEEPNVDAPESLLIQEKPEPDIVQSTKKEPPPRPVAPPRTKRNKAAPPRPPPPQALRASGSIEEKAPVVAASCSAPVKGLPTDLSKGPSPTSTVLGLTKDLEHSLNIHSATSGSRMVTAKEEVSAKAERTEEEKQNEAADADSKQLLASVPQEKNNEKEEEKMDKKDEDKVVAKMRPRSNSGSRFLTDQEILGSGFGAES